jgi:peptidylprolyl isomerase
MKIFLLIALMSLLTVSSFSQYKTPKIKKNKEYTSASGLAYTVFDFNKKATTVDSGDVVSVHYVGRLDDGTIFDASYERMQPITFQVGTGKVIKGWDEGLQYLHLGDSALLVIPPQIAYGERAMGLIPAHATLSFTVKIVDVIKAIKPYNVTKLDSIHLEDGLSYMVVEEGQGDGIKINEKAYVQYSGYFTDGKKFDSSYDNGGKSFDFILGRKRVIAGWEKGVLGMKVGEKRRINVPYALAYGEKGRAPIPPKSDLVFDVLLEEIENMNYPQFDLAGKDTITLPSGIKYILAEQTQGKKVVPHDTVVIKYVGKFMDGTVFDASYDRNDTLVFEVASKMVIKGLDEGLLFLKEGEKARFIIPYEMAYGEEGREPIIPAKSDLIFDIYLQKVIDGKKGF